MNIVHAFRVAEVLADLMPDAPVIPRKDMAVAAALAGVDTPTTATDRAQVCEALDAIEARR